VGGVEGEFEWTVEEVWVGEEDRESPPPTPPGLGEGGELCVDAASPPPGGEGLSVGEGVEMRGGEGEDAEEREERGVGDRVEEVDWEKEGMEGDCVEDGVMV